MRSLVAGALALAGIVGSSSSAASLSGDEQKIVAGHSSGVGQAGGYGAVYELARIIDEFRRDLPEPNLTFNTSLIARLSHP